jgi:hypothetical protein
MLRRGMDSSLLPVDQFGCGLGFAACVAQALLPVRFCELRLRQGFTCNCKNRTGKSACATKTCSEQIQIAPVSTARQDARINMDIFSGRLANR